MRRLTTPNEPLLNGPVLLEDNFGLSWRPHDDRELGLLILEQGLGVLEELGITDASLEGLIDLLLNGLEHASLEPLDPDLGFVGVQDSFGRLHDRSWAKSSRM